MHVIFRRYLPIIPQGPGEFFDGLVDEGDCFIVDENGEYIVSIARTEAPTFTLSETISYDTSVSGLTATVDVTVPEKLFVKIDWGDGPPVTQNEQGGNTTQSYSHTYETGGVYEIKVFTSG